VSVAEEYLAAVSRGDRGGALDVVRRMQAEGASPLDVMNDVIAPAQSRVGELWARDTWSVAQEHAATAVSEAVLGLLGALVPPPSEHSAPVVVTCVEQEWHALPALLVAEHLRTAGLPVSYLGANSSAEHLVRHVHETAPRAVLLSCSLAASLPRVRRQVEAVRATGTPVVGGGAAFDTEGRRAAALGADAYAPDGAAAVLTVRALPTATLPMPTLPSATAEEGLAVQADREELTARLRQRLLPAEATGQPWQRVLEDHLAHLVGSVAGALVTDDPTVLDESLTWLANVLAHRQAPPEATERVVVELAGVVREYPAAARLLSAGPAATG
jgi:methanogenic corrinoid protein MtbC1